MKDGMDYIVYRKVKSEPQRALFFSGDLESIKSLWKIAGSQGMSIDWGNGELFATIFPGDFEYNITAGQWLVTTLEGAEQKFQVLTDKKFHEKYRVEE